MIISELLIYKFRKDLSSVRNVFQQKGTFEQLHSEIADHLLVMLFTRLSCKVQLHSEGHPWKIKKSEESLLLGLSKQKSFVRVTVQRIMEASWMASLLDVRQDLTFIYELHLQM